MNRSAVLRWATRLAVVGVLVVLLLRVGAAPFVSGIAHLTVAAVLAASALTGVATLAAAWRWRTIGSALGLALPFGGAISAYYRSQLLNTLLPGGVAGDVARGLGDGSAGRLRRLEAVAWDRGSGQLVQLVLLAVVLGATSPSLGGAIAAVLATAGVLVVAAGLVLGIPRSGGRPAQAVDGRLRRLAHVLRDDARSVLGRPRVLVPVLLCSTVVALAHAAVLVLAATITGTSTDVLRLLPVALVVQAATALPSGFGGLGVREGVAAAVFAAAGWGAAQGVEAGTASGALALLAVLPGLLPLVGGRIRHLRVDRSRAAGSPVVAR